MGLANDSVGRRLIDMGAPPEKKKRGSSWLRKLAYSIGAVPSALPYNAIASYFLMYYELVLGLSIEYFTLLWIIYSIWNAVNDPLAGYIMDRTRTRWGRRIPHILFWGVPLGITFFLIWWVPFKEPFQIFLYGLLMICLYDTAFTFALGAWNALYTEMYETTAERADVVVVKDAIAFLSSAAGMMITPILVAMFGWPGMGIVIGLISVATLYISLIGTKEKAEYSVEEPLGLVSSITSTFRNKPFLYAAVLLIMTEYAFGTLTMVLPIYGRFVLGLKVEETGLTMVGVVVAVLLGLPFWGYVYKKLGEKTTYLLTNVVFAVGLVPIFLASDLTQLMLLSVVPGFGVAGTLMSEPLLSLVMDYDEVLTEKRREAMYNGVLTFISRLTLVLTALTQLAVQTTTGFIPDIAAVQPASAIAGLKLTLSLFPPLALFLGLLVFVRFPLTKREVPGIRARLEKIHAEKRKKLEEMLQAKANKAP